MTIYTVYFTPSTISNFRYTSAGVRSVALFGYVYAPTAEIKRVLLQDPNVDGGDGFCCGGLVAFLREGSITNCGVMGGSVSGAYADTGGLVGYNDGKIHCCYSTATVFGDSDWGAAGLVGVNAGIVLNCYATGAVSGSGILGGLSGTNFGAVINCYAAGPVESGCCLVNGGFVGGRWGPVVNSYFDIEATCWDCGYGGTGKTNVEMKMASTFLGWGCGGVWTIDEGNDYPRLWWEERPGVPITNESYLEGSGSGNDPYIIRSAEQLNKIGLFYCDWDKHFILANDVNMAAYDDDEYNNIGADPFAFTGVFDGNGHSISNLSCDYGMFEVVEGAEAEVRNLTLVNPDAYCAPLVWKVHSGRIYNCAIEGGIVSAWGDDGIGGGLVAHNMYGTILGCYAVTDVEGAPLFPLGGLVGINEYGTIAHCYSEGTVEGSDEVGGLVGENRGTISNSWSQATVSGAFRVGGLAGTNSGSIIGCYTLGVPIPPPWTFPVTGDYSAGGLVGCNYSTGAISDCYSATFVSSGISGGGLLGYNSGYVSNCYSASISWGGISGFAAEDDGGSYKDCFWNTDFEPNGIGSMTDPNVIGKSTEELQNRVTFTDRGWDFVGEAVNGPNDLWRMCVDDVDYPKLAWEFTSSDFVCPDGVNGLDFAYFASWWMEGDCDSKDDCGGADLDISGVVDRLDLKILCDWWLGGID